MEWTQEEKLEIQGFRNGYFFASKSKVLQNKVLDLKHTASYLKGFIKGIEEYKRHLEITSPSLSKIEERRAKLKKIADRENGLDKDELER